MLCKDSPSIFQRKKPRSRRISKAFGLVFRDPKDLGETREMMTPTSDVILKNMLTFLKEHHKHLKAMKAKNRNELEKALSELVKHIDKGCLSGIKAGWGTKANEGLHKLLNRSMLRGVPKMSPEMARTVLTIIFHHHNAKKEKRRHVCNKDINVCTHRIDVKLRKPNAPLYKKSLSEIVKEGSSAPTDWKRFIAFFWSKIININKVICYLKVSIKTTRLCSLMIKVIFSKKDKRSNSTCQYFTS